MSDKGDDARLRASQMSEALFNGGILMQMILERDASAPPDAAVVEHLAEAENALRGFIELRDRGQAQGGPQYAAAEDLERLQRLRTLIHQGALKAAVRSPEIDDLARQLLAVFSGKQRGLL